MAMAAADRDHPGGAFAAGPSDHDLIAFVLRPMAAGHHGFDGGGGFIHMADVYSVAPERLAERYAPAPRTAADGGGDMEVWYFVCPARCRHRAAAAGALGQGCWATSPEAGAVGSVRGPDGRRVGQRRALSYGARAAAPWAAVTRHGWCMVELALDEGGGGGGGAGGGGDFVLCRLFRSPRNEASATAAAASTAVPAALVSGCKRKAAVDNHPEAPPSVRRQLMQHSF